MSLRIRENRKPTRHRRRKLETLEPRLLLADTSPPAFLQWFESSYDTIEERTADVFAAGYGAVWLPPPGRADISDFSVGYDVYDRFDLGGPRDETLYGTATGIKTVADTFDRASVDLHLDAIINHTGFSDIATPGCVESGGYPGFLITADWDIDGDFNSAYRYDDLQMRLAGLVDINHAKDYQFIRHPVSAGDPDNIPSAGTTPDGAGRLANLPDASNRQFYPDKDGPAIYVFDPSTGESGIPIYSFNVDCPECGDPGKENATGYLMRYLQWAVQVVGVDGFRLDAAKHVEGFAFNFFDRAVYRQNPRLLLDGSPKHVFSYSEVFDGNRSYLQGFIRKDINPFDPGRIGGNRDVLDFSQYFVLRDNLTGNGFANDWRNIVYADMDTFDDGLRNGSAGVKFVQSHDDFPPHLGNVAHAYMLMLPGNAVVYLNGKEFGDNRDFPKGGRGDALGGVYGDAVKKLVQIRNTHGRGDFRERWLEKELFAFERSGSAVVGLSNRLDGGFDERWVNVDLPYGTYLVELTGNASNPAIDPFDDIPEVIQVTNDCFECQSKVSLRIPRNTSPNGNNHNSGYVVYGLATPQAPAGLQLSNVDSILPGSVPNATDYDNGITRLSDLHVIKADSFDVQLQTVPVNLLGSIRDAPADGDNALLRIDGGFDANGNGYIDYTTPGSVSYGFEAFQTKHSDLWTGGDGEFRQTVDATQLAEGTHFIEVIAFRHRDDGGPPVYSSFRKSVYVDRLPPQVDVMSFDPFQNDPGTLENRDLVIQSLDKTADSVHVFRDLPAAITEQQILDYVLNGTPVPGFDLGNAGGQAAQIDRDQFVFGYTGLQHGNHVATTVTFEPTGTVSVQRLPGQFTESIIGAGLGDVTYDGQYNVDDVNTFRWLLEQDNTQFSPAADMNGDGLIHYADLVLFCQRLVDVGADPATQDAHRQLHEDYFVAVDDPGYATNEDTTLDIAPPGVLGNDHDPSAIGGNLNLTAGTFSSIHGAQVTLNSDGSFRYDPTSAGLLQALNSGQSIVDTFQYSITDGWGSMDTATVSVTVTGVTDGVPPSVVGRHLFYKNSYFDDVSDDNAIADDKSALLPGHTTSFQNYSSYSRGINGVMIDLQNPTNGTAIDASDFVFRNGNEDPSAAWTAAPQPASVTVRSGAGVGGADRVVISWDDNLIRNTWLEVTVLANGRTGLASNDVFYFGNAVGDSVGQAVVNGFDYAGPRDNPHGMTNRAAVTDRFDYNRDSLVDGADLAIARDQANSFLNTLRWISVPAAPPPPSPAPLVWQPLLLDTLRPSSTEDDRVDELIYLADDPIRRLRLLDWQL